MRILNFEDNVYKQNDIAKAVRSGGFGMVQIECARNFEDGLELLRSRIRDGNGYDLIITDMWYPEKSGGADVEAGEKLIHAVSENGWNIPIILCSSVQYRIPGIVGCVHYSESGDWEAELVQLIKNLSASKN